MTRKRNLYTLWGIGTGWSHPIKLTGGTLAQCKREARSTFAAPYYHDLRIGLDLTPPGDPNWSTTPYADAKPLHEC